MRIDDPNPPASGRERLRAPVDRLRRWLSGPEAGPRRVLALGVAAALVAVAYYAAAPADPVALEALFGGQRFSPAEVVTIRATLAEKRISPVRVDDRGRVAIPLDRMTEAIAALEKRHLADRSLDEIRDEARKGSIFEGPDERRQRQLQGQERTLEALIEQLAGVVQADVMIKPLPVAGLGARARSAKALVRVQTEGDRPLASTTVKTILHLLAGGTDFDLAPEAVTLLGPDQTYLSAGEPSRLRHALARAHEEELAEEVRGRLAGIDGVQVSARLEADPPAPGGIDPPPMPGPAGLPPLPPLPPAAGGPERARIVVLVPRGYYRHVVGTIAPGRTPTPEEIEAYREQIDAKIRAMVAQAVPAAEFGGVTIETSADPVPAPRAAEVAPAPAARDRPWWGPAALAGVIAVLAAATLRAAARRPSARLPRPPRAPHFGPAAAGPGPGSLERVRELVRLNPEAAAGVLQRWVGQGGRAA